MLMGSLYFSAPFFHARTYNLLYFENQSQIKKIAEDPFKLIMGLKQVLSCKLPVQGHMISEKTSQKVMRDKDDKTSRVFNYVA